METGCQVLRICKLPSRIPRAVGELGSIVEALRDEDAAKFEFYNRQDTKVVSFSEMYELISGVAKRLSIAGLSSDSGIVLILENSFEATLLDLTLLKIACTTIHLPDDGYADIEERVGADRIDFILIDSRCYEKVNASLFEIVHEVINGICLYRRKRHDAACIDSGLWRFSSIDISSGTSGRVKKILLNSDGVVYNAQRFFTLFPRVRGDKFLIFFTVLELSTEIAHLRLYPECN